MKGKDDKIQLLLITTDLTDNLEIDLSKIKICIPKIVYDTELDASIRIVL